MSFDKSKVFIIAEAGVNHNGDIDLAYKLIDGAKAAGVDAVKFQTGKPEKVVAKWASKAKYQQVTTGVSDSQLEMIKKIALPNESFRDLQSYCNKKEIKFFSTAFEHDALHFLMSLKMDIIKIPSGELTNLPYLRAISKYHDAEIIMSTGMANMTEIRSAMKVLVDGGISKQKISVLHCNTEYPTPYEDVNLKTMLSLGRDLGVAIGYSDHTKGIEVSLAAVAMGASIIEKHFTLDRTMIGPDHTSSLELHELKQMVNSIRNIELAIKGDAVKCSSPSEMKNISIARRSIVAGRDIKQGEILTVENLAAKRPATGISPMNWDSIVGTRAKKDYMEDDLIEI